MAGWSIHLDTQHRTVSPTAVQTLQGYQEIEGIKRIGEDMQANERTPHFLDDLVKINHSSSYFLSSMPWGEAFFGEP